MWNRVKWAMVLALVPVALGQAGCNLEDATRPPLAGPSELGKGLTVTANPDQLTANGNSSSVIEVTVYDELGQPLVGITVNFDLAQKFAGAFSDIGVLAPLNGRRPVPGGQEPKAESAVTNSQGKARVRYWSPFRTDQENDTVVTITARPAGSDFNAAIFRSVDIFLRAANRPQFPGSSVCGFIVEPQQTAYTPGQQIFFTATQLNGDTSVAGCAGNSIARYEWDFGDGTIGPAERGVAHAFSSTGDFTVTLFTTESQTGCQDSCIGSITVTTTGAPPVDDTPDDTCPAPSASFAVSQICATGEILADDTNATIFNGSASTAGTGENIVTYRWSFGDGASSSGASATTSHVYASTLDGLQVSPVLTVTNSCGATASTSLDFDVVAACP